MVKDTAKHEVNLDKESALIYRLRSLYRIKVTLLVGCLLIWLAISGYYWFGLWARDSLLAPVLQALGGGVLFISIWLALELKFTKIQLEVAIDEALVRLQKGLKCS